ncbi:MAG: endonuclease/exonuclease/phosphatase family protein [Flavobacteriaceae bacterium]
MSYGQSIDVITYNIRYDNPKDSLNSWDHRKAFLIGQLRFYEPSVFGTQEGLLHQLKDIDNKLEQYSYFGKGRDDGRTAGEFSAVFYDKTELELVKEATFWLSESPDIPSKGWDAAIKRVCTYGLLKTKDESAFFWVFNTHFDHVGEQARKESVLLILKKIAEVNTQGYPVILMGDLNLEPQHSSIQFLSDKLEDTHLLAAENAFGPKGTFNGFRFDEPVNRRIDYIFVSKGDFDVEKYGILSDSKECRYPSDHLPVYTKLRLMN